MKTMRVAEYDRYGDTSVIAIRERPVPVPSEGEALVRVRAAALNPKDVLIRRGKFPVMSGRTFPKRMGYDFAGEIVSVHGASPLREGDAVYGMIQRWSAGAVAEYVAVPLTELTRRPAELSFEEAAAVPLAALTALQALRDEGRLREGQRTLINGASGGVGIYAVQLGKHLGAHVVTATSAANLDFVRALGADETLDYRSADLAHVRPSVDVFFDAFGNQSAARVRGSLTDGGTYVTTIPSGRAVALHLLTRFSRRRSRLVVVRSNVKDLDLLARLADEGALRPVIERVFAIDEVARAHEALESRRTRGKLVVRID